MPPESQDQNPTNQAPVPDPPKPPPTAQNDDDGGKGGKEAVLADLHRTRQEKKELADKLEALEAATKSEQEKAVDAARKEGSAEASAKFTARITSQAMAVAATGLLANPADAELYLDAAALPKDADGIPTQDGIKAALADVVKERPYLKGAAAPALPGSTNQPANSGASGLDMNSRLRQAAGRG